MQTAGQLSSACDWVRWIGMWLHCQITCAKAPIISPAQDWIACMVQYVLAVILYNGRTWKHVTHFYPCWWFSHMKIPQWESCAPQLVSWLACNWLGCLLKNTALQKTPSVKEVFTVQLYCDMWIPCLLLSSLQSVVDSVSRCSELRMFAPWNLAEWSHWHTNTSAHLCRRQSWCNPDHFLNLLSEPHSFRAWVQSF